MLALSHLALAMPLCADENTKPPTPAPAPPHLLIPRLNAAVRLDGQLDEPVWAKAALLTPFARNQDAGTAREATQLRLWYDAQALYLGWVCRDTNIQATLTNRDSPLFQEDAVEFFLTPKELGRYFEFEWNPLGAIFDATIRNHLRSDGTSRYFQGDSSYNATSMQCAAKIKGRLNHSASCDHSWQLEIRLPFADLGVAPPRPHEVWRFNAFRVNHTQGVRTEFLSWCPTFQRSFHEPNRFAYLEFGP